MAINSFKQAGLANTNTIERIPPDADFSNTATGTYTDGEINYKYITYNSSGTLTVTTAGFADVLVIAGGGGAGGAPAGWGGGGAGGAGGLIYQMLDLVVGTYTVTIGGGGSRDSAGSPTYFFTQGKSLVAYGGGRGGRSDYSGAGVDAGQPGGSGGGGGFDHYGSRSGGAPIAGQGYAGNTGGAIETPGGGGGAGGAAPVGSNSAGPGLSLSITGSAVVYAKGGGTGTATTNNTGNGGSNSSAGASGVVIVRVKV